MRSIVVVCISSTLLVACSSATGIDLTEKSALDTHQAQWERLDNHTYSFDYTEQKLGITYRKHITVLDDTVADVFDIGSDVSDDTQQGWPTIDSLFATARRDLNSKGIDLTIEYDSRLGYPTELYAISRPANPGGGFRASVAHLNSLPIEPGR